MRLPETPLHTLVSPVGGAENPRFRKYKLSRSITLATETPSVRDSKSTSFTLKKPIPYGHPPLGVKTAGSGSPRPGPVSISSAPRGRFQG